MFAIYLPNDNERWFKVSFSSKARAEWFAEANDLGPDDYEVRGVNDKIKPSVSVEVFEAEEENQKMVA
jgi:hypothetical protein